MVTTDVPVHLWTAFVWPIACLFLGGFVASAIDVSKKNPLLVVVPLLLSLTVTYGFAMVAASLFSIDGFFGILAYHGEVEAWSPTKWSFLTCPVTTIVGAWILSFRKKRK